jgi:hypothetical protein
MNRKGKKWPGAKKNGPERKKMNRKGKNGPEQEKMNWNEKK